MDNIENIYKLSPLQEGMLFHHLDQSSSGAYMVQNVFRFEGEFEVESLEKSFEILSKRYAILRTSFVYQGMKKPRQVVLADRRLEFSRKELDQSVAEEEALAHWLEEDRRRGFDLTQDPLMRFCILESKENETLLATSYHHIILDGWSVGLLMKDLIEVYQSLRSANAVVSKNAVSYGEYIKWIGKQNRDAGLEFWKQSFEGYVPPATSLLSEFAVTDMPFKQAEESVVFDLATTENLKALANEWQVTLSSLFHCIWGMVVSSLTEEGDVVFASVTSGRNREIERVEEMVGLLVNSIPLRVEIENADSFEQLAKTVQQKILKSECYSFLSISDIEATQVAGRSGIDHLLAFENFPRSEAMNDGSIWSGLGVRLLDAQVIEQANYDFIVVVHANNELIVKLRYNYARVTKGFVKKVIGCVESMVTSALTHSGGSVAQVLGRPLDSFGANRKSKEVLLGAQVLDSVSNEIEFVAPQTETEKKIAAICCDVMEIDKIGKNDNFFYSGANSIAMIHLMSRITEAFDVELSFNQIMENATVGGVGEVVDNALWVKEEPAVVLSEPSASETRVRGAV